MSAISWLMLENLPQKSTWTSSWDLSSLVSFSSRVALSWPFFISVSMTFSASCITHYLNYRGSTAESAWALQTRAGNVQKTLSILVETKKKSSACWEQGCKHKRCEADLWRHKAFLKPGMDSGVRGDMSAEKRIVNKKRIPRYKHQNAFTC